MRRNNKEPHAPGSLQMLPSSLGPPPAHLSHASTIPSSLGLPPAHFRAALGPTVSAGSDSSGASAFGSDAQTALAPSQNIAPRSRMLQSRPSTASAATISRKSVDFSDEHQYHHQHHQNNSLNRGKNELLVLNEPTRGGGGGEGEGGGGIRSIRPSSASSVPSASQINSISSSNSSSRIDSSSNISSGANTDVQKKPLWKACVDPSNGKQYWGNRITKKSQWQRPPEEELLSTVTVDANGNVVVEKNEVGENDGSEGGGKDVTSTL